MTGHPVAVLGAGVCSPAGSSLDEFWSGLSRAPRPTEHLTSELAADFATRVMRVVDVPLEARLEPHELRRLDRHILLAKSSAADAMAGIEVDDPERWAICVGVGYGAGRVTEEQSTRMRTKGVRAVSPLTIPLGMPNSVAGHLALEHGIRGPVLTVATACASGANAIGEAMWLLRTNRVDRVLAGGVDSMLYATALAGFVRLGALSTTDAVHPSRPFDRDRDGFVMGEGAAFVVLGRAADSSSDAVLGELLGYAANDDASHLVAPLEDGSGAARCMTEAISDAGLVPSDVGHVNAHGTSTELNDLAEAAAIRRVFGSTAPPVTAPKGVTGHMIGGSGAAEVVATLLSCRQSTVPPVGGLENIDERIDLDVVAGAPRRVGSRLGVTNSFAFGGHNASLVIAA